MGVKWWTALVDLFDPAVLPRLKNEPAASPSIILIDGKALVWRLPEQLEYARGAADSAAAQVAWLTRLGDFDGLYAAAAALSAYLRALGFTPVLVMEGWGDDCTDLKVAGLNPSAHDRPMPDRVAFEQALASRAADPAISAADMLRARGAYGWTPTRLAATEGEITSAFAHAGVQVRVTMGEADLVWEARRESVAAVLTDDTDAFYAQSLRVVRSAWVPWGRLLAPGVVDAAAVAAEMGLPFATGGDHFLRTLNQWLPESQPPRVLVPSDLPELALLCGTDYTKELPALFVLQRSTFLAGGASTGGGAQICRNFAKGSCRYGHRCQFAHDVRGSGGSGGGAGGRPQPPKEIAKLVKAAAWLAHWRHAGGAGRTIDAHPAVSGFLARHSPDVDMLSRALTYARQRVYCKVMPLEDRPATADGGALALSAAARCRLLSGAAAGAVVSSELLKHADQLWGAVERAVISGRLSFGAA